LFHAAFCSLVSDEENTAYYHRPRTIEKKAHREAMIDLMRKQVRRLVAVLCNQRPFVKTTSPTPPATTRRKPPTAQKKPRTAA
jgi:hypothetical protein